MNIIVLILMVLICFNYGCRQVHPQSSLNEICIDDNVDNFQPMKICDYDCEIRYVFLQTDSVFLKVAALSAFKDDFILVSDRAKCILYGRDGKGGQQIGRIGKGPGEYGTIFKIGFGPDNNVYIYDGKYLSVFNLIGDFLYKFKPEGNPGQNDSDIYLGSFGPVNDSVFIGQIRNDSGHEKFKAVFFDKLGRSIKFVDNYNVINMRKPYSTSENGDANIYVKGNDVCFKERFSDTVFRIDEQYRLVPTYVLKLGKYHLPTEVRELSLSEFNKLRWNYIEVYNFFEVAGLCILSCAFHNHHPIRDRDNFQLPGTKPQWAWSILGVYDNKENGLSFTEVNTSGTYLTCSGFENDFDGGINFFPQQQVNDSTLAMWIDVDLLKEHVASREFKNSKPKFPGKKMYLEHSVIALSDYDNPVLMMCTFKKSIGTIGKSK